MELPEIPIHDHRRDGLLGFALAHIDEARAIMAAVLRGMGPAGRALRLALPMGDRMAERRLRVIGDPYLEELRAIRTAVARPGPMAFALSYEFGCTARAFEDGTLFRTLDWPFHGLGRLVRLVKLEGPAGPWITATWPGVVGALHGVAPGRFAAALNQAPERQGRFGRAADWMAGRRRVFRGTGLPPTHLLRQVFETARDWDAAREMLTRAPVAAPVIFTLAAPGRAVVIERCEGDARLRDAPAVATNHFQAPDFPGRWRCRGHLSPERAEQARGWTAPPAVDALEAPVLNDLTRLALCLRPDGAVSVAGYEGSERVTAARHLPALLSPAALPSI